MINIFINGFGRIGQALYNLAKHSKDFNIVGINDIEEFELDRVKTYCVKNPEDLDLSGVDVCIQANGKYLTLEQNEIFLKKGAKRVVISAPSPDAPHFMVGINEGKYLNEKIFSTSSCSATAIAPVIKLFSEFGIKSCYSSMIHSYTNDQALLDRAKPYMDIRRTRSATLNILPLYSTAPKAVRDFFPDLEIDAKSIRVPLAYCTFYDITLILKRDIKDLHRCLKESCKGFITYTFEPKVSSDFIKDCNFLTYDLNFCKSYDKIVKISAWQDNEYGYSNQLLQTIKVLS